MLDKNSEKVLHYIIDNAYDGKTLFPVDNPFDNISGYLLDSIAHSLEKDGYIHAIYSDEGIYATILENKGQTYFQCKHAELIKTWAPYAVTTLIAISALVNSIFARLNL